VDIKDLKQIIELMKRSELTELEIEEANLKLRLRRELTSELVNYADRPMRTVAPVMVESPAMPPATIPVSAPVLAEDKNVVFIKSPMVGTFYRASSPESTPFVSLGMPLNPESVVCIIEAMKVLNEIHAELSGTVVEILVENGQSVEYGQPLFKIKQS
jgi:acetyl-CoA carboxylase biotin carboxyl carrier protein